MTVTFYDIYFGLDSTGAYVAYSNESGIYDWTGLTPNTNYTLKYKAYGISLGVYSEIKYLTGSSITATTLNNQTRILIKNNGSWVYGVPYVKTNGSWIQATSVYVKTNGSWSQGIN